MYKPQLEALETYIYIKEILGNKSTVELIPKLFDTEKELLEVLPLTDKEKLDLIYCDDKNKLIQEILLKEYGTFEYANQVYALTMGSGKTILMGTIILYEFLLSTFYKEDKRFAKNILVFAPDKTIIESLKEIKSFDYTAVIPNEYINILLNIKYHYLESTDTVLNFIGNYNVIVSNSQKIILKTKHKENTEQRLLNSETVKKGESVANDRLQKIKRLENLTILVDEAHHSYGNTLSNDLKKTRETIKYLNENAKTSLVNVVNFTGTPYVNNKLINDVVFHFGLKQGIEQGILKQVRFLEYDNVKSEYFIKV